MNGLGEALRDSTVLNLDTAVTMVVDDAPFSLELTVAALRGFGIRPKYACHSAAEAMAILQNNPVDLLVVDSEMPGLDGYELVRWLRRSGTEQAFTPVIMTAGHVRRSRLAEARDCGINFLITKPFSATTLLERVVWVARDTRPFLEVGDYFGPDRRLRSGTRTGGDERRADMLALAAEGESSLPAEASE